MTELEIESTTTDMLAKIFLENSLNSEIFHDRDETRKYDTCVKNIVMITDELYFRSSIDILFPLMKHENPWARCSAAIACWNAAEESARAVLEEVGRIRKGEAALRARGALNNFRAGRNVVRRLGEKRRTAD
jgi:hypothetical protein